MRYVQDNSKLMLLFHTPAIVQLLWKVSLSFLPLTFFPKKQNHTDRVIRGDRIRDSKKRRNGVHSKLIMNSLL